MVTILVLITTGENREYTVIVSWVLAEMLSVNLGVNWLSSDQDSSKSIDQHSTMDALSTQYPSFKHEGTYSHISFVKKSRGRTCSSRCGGLHVHVSLSLVSSNTSCMDWVGGWNRIWTDSGSWRCIYKVMSDLTQKNNCKPPWNYQWYVWYITT